VRAPIGIRIRRRRLAIGLSQAALARGVGISPTYLNLIENNKRAIGGSLLARIGERLGLELAQLSGDSEARAIQAVEELLADPAMKGIEMEQAAIRDFVARFPEAGLALKRLYGHYLDASSSIEAYLHRLRSDPLLSAMLHQVLNRISGISSSAEILDSEPNLTDEEEKRFVATISKESEDLARTVRNRGTTSTGPRQPEARFTLADLDEAIIAARNHFPRLEAVADELGARLRPMPGRTEQELERLLQTQFGVGCRILPPDVQIARQHQYVEAERELRFGASAAVSTRVFQMARLYASKAAADAIEDAVGTMELNSDEARDLARNAMSSYVAGALMMPYERFLADAEELRYDIDVLGRLYGASFEQIAHRLVTLRRRGAEGLPFGFLRTDRAGRLSKRFPLPGLALPASGYGCVLWPIYRAFAESGYVRQVAEFPNKARYLLLARAVTKQAPGYGVEAPTYSIMLACDVVHADRTVYARGLDLSHQPALVGPSCLLCPRQECSHRY